MATVVSLTFNPFQENTYLVFDETKECVVFDPGCLEVKEKEELKSLIDHLQLQPVRLINTHCHIDHIFGNKFISETFQLPLEIHQGELDLLNAAPQVSNLYGNPYPDHSPAPEKYIHSGDVLEFGNTKLEAIFTPGHSPASLSFYCKEDQFLIAGDVLFHESIGRTDLPGGDFDTLISSIKNQLFPLGNEVKVYPGHGSTTTIGHEKEHNPFL